MIHRIDRVNPDVDDRVIKPNEARMAYNLRFGASTEDTNLSGGTLVLGNAQVPFTPPAGTCKVVGVYADLESRNVYFALYNDNGTPYPNHGLYQIETENNNQVNPIVTGTWLNFQGGDDYNVSMTSVSGLLYWTDNINEPRMVNIAKGIRTQQNPNGPDVYPIAVEDWYYTQIKRPPGEALEVSPQLEQDPYQVSLTYVNRAANSVGFQYSYYYIYDNNEESRLAPYTLNTYGNYDITLTIPNDEFNQYTKVKSLIKAIVIVIRNGNDGVWQEIRNVKNDGATQSFLFANILATSRTTVSADITDARFDSVPLLSKTNEIAQNKINHANYLLDYDAVDNIQFDCKIQKLFTIVNNPDYYNDPRVDFVTLRDINKSFCPWGRYAIGIEFVDKYGRTIPVRNTVDRYASYWDLYRMSQGGDETINYPLQSGQGSQSVFSQTKDTTSGYIGYGIQNFGVYTISGALPNWVDRVNIVRSKAKNIIKINQSAGFLYAVYRDKWNNEYLLEYAPFSLNPLLRAPVYNNMNSIQSGGGDTNKLTFIGYAMVMNSGEPFVFEKNQYIYIINRYYTGSMKTPSGLGYDYDVGKSQVLFKFKVRAINGTAIYFDRFDTPDIHPDYLSSTVYFGPKPTLTALTFPLVALFNGFSWSVSLDTNKYYPLMYNFALTTESDIDDSTLYVAKTIKRGEYESQMAQYGNVRGVVYGDLSVCRAEKIYSNKAFNGGIYSPGKNFNPQPKNPEWRIPLEIPLPVYGGNPLSWGGWFLSMNPVDIYSSEWNQDIGQVNTTNYKDSEDRRLESNICFSGSIIQGTQVNGLNKFNSLDFRQAPAENGPITSLVVTNATQREPGVMLAVGSFGVSSFYYDAIQLNNVDGSDNVTTTNTYLGSQRPLLGQYGTTRPMSITKTPLGTVYWWSDVVNDLIRYTNAGLERLGMTFSFANFLRRTYNNQPLIITWYDQVTDEINLYSPGPGASVFSERYKTFQGIREYSAGVNRAIGTATKQFMFRGEEIWVTDVEADPITGPGNNQFFGTYLDPMLDIVTNENPAIVKRWNQIKVFGSKPTSVRLVAPSETSPLNTLESKIDKEFIQRKNDWEAAIRRADNTPGGLMAGKLMESRILISKFAWQAEGFQKLNFIEVKSNVSIVQ